MKMLFVSMSLKNASYILSPEISFTCHPTPKVTILVGTNSTTTIENNWCITTEELMLKLKIQYFGHLIWRTDSLEKTLMLERLKAGGEGEDREWYRWVTSLTQWTGVWASCGRKQRTGKLGMLQLMGSQRVGQNWLSEQQRPQKVSHLPIKNKDISSHIRPVYRPSSSIFHILIASTDTGLCPHPLHFLHYSHTSDLSVVFPGQAHFCLSLRCIFFFTLSLTILTFQVYSL